jgi:hypothetical protein
MLNFDAGVITSVSGCLENIMSIDIEAPKEIVVSGVSTHYIKEYISVIKNARDAYGEAASPFIEAIFSDELGDMFPKREHIEFGDVIASKNNTYGIDSEYNDQIMGLWQKNHIRYWALRLDKFGDENFITSFYRGQKEIEFSVNDIYFMNRILPFLYMIYDIGSNGMGIWVALLTCDDKIELLYESNKECGLYLTFKNLIKSSGKCLKKLINDPTNQHYISICNENYNFFAVKLKNPRYINSKSVLAVAASIIFDAEKFQSIYGLKNIRK